MIKKSEPFKISWRGSVSIPWRMALCLVLFIATTSAYAPPPFNDKGEIVIAEGEGDLVLSDEAATMIGNMKPKNVLVGAIDTRNGVAFTHPVAGRESEVSWESADWQEPQIFFGKPAKPIQAVADLPAHKQLADIIRDEYRSQGVDVPARNEFLGFGIQMAEKEPATENAAGAGDNMRIIAFRSRSLNGEHVRALHINQLNEGKMKGWGKVFEEQEWIDSADRRTVRTMMRRLRGQAERGSTRYKKILATIEDGVQGEEGSLENYVIKHVKQIETELEEWEGITFDLQGYIDRNRNTNIWGMLNEQYGQEATEGGEAWAELNQMLRDTSRGTLPKAAKKQVKEMVQTKLKKTPGTCELVVVEGVM